MGWPLAVSAGLMERSSRALVVALWPLTVGHLLAMFVVILPFALRLRTAAATIMAGVIERRALDDVVLTDIGCQPHNTAMAVIAEHLVIPVELSPAGILVTARPLRGRGSSWE